MFQLVRPGSRLSQSLYCFLTLATRCSCLALMSCFAWAAFVFSAFTLVSPSRRMASRRALDFSSFSCNFAFSASMRPWSDNQHSVHDCFLRSGLTSTALVASLTSVFFFRCYFNSQIQRVWLRAPTARREKRFHFFLPHLIRRQLATPRPITNAL